MSWDTVIGHQSALERFQKSVSRNRLASTYLFVGDDGIGKRTFALKLAQAILCDRNSIETLTACEECPACVQVKQKTHPDLLLVSKPENKSILPVDLFIGKGDKRRREGLVYDIGLKPFCGGYRIAIIDDADYFNTESANCLLKTLEEPPPNSLIILLGTSQQRQLQTIVSRSQVVRFDPLSNQQVADVLATKGLIAGDEPVESQAPIDVLAAASGGSVGRALQLADPEVLEFRQTLLQRLSSGDPHAGDFCKQLIGFAESAGKENYLKRRRIALIADFTIEFYRHCILELSASQASAELADSTMANCVNAFAQRYLSNPAAGAEYACGCIDRTSNFRYHVFANAGLPNAVDSWLIDLGRLGRGEQVTTGDTLQGTF